MSNLNHLCEPNRLNWNNRARIHAEDTTGFYRLNELRTTSDFSNLTPVESKELGNVLKTGPKVLHLQCHIGTDSISLLRQGAKEIVGVDLSDESIKVANQLAKDTNSKATFYNCNVYDTPKTVADRDFDLVFTSWGTYGWLPDLNPWAKDAIFEMLKPGGLFYIADGHPTMYLMDPSQKDLQVIFPWKNSADEPFVMTEDKTYNGDERVIEAATTHEWNHPISSIITALLQAGMELVFFHEHEMIPWKGLNCLEKVPGQGVDMYQFPSDYKNKIPVAFSLMARKPQ